MNVIVAISAERSISIKPTKNCIVINVSNENNFGQTYVQLALNKNIIIVK